jgi:hypothetical protein
MPTATSSALYQHFFQVSGFAIPQHALIEALLAFSLAFCLDQSPEYLFL